MSIKIGNFINIRCLVVEFDDLGINSMQDGLRQWDYVNITGGYNSFRKLCGPTKLGINKESCLEYNEVLFHVFINTGDIWVTLFAWCTQYSPILPNSSTVFPTVQSYCLVLATRSCTAADSILVPSHWLVTLTCLISLSLSHTHAYIHSLLLPLDIESIETVFANYQLNVRYYDEDM